MPEMKRNFSKARMNKDADERTLQTGEYRHALNVQVNNSGEGDVGALQNIKGNTKITGVLGGGTYVSDESDICVGMVKHVSTDSIYYFINSSNGAIKKNYILEYNSITSELKFVFVDIYEVSVSVNVDGVSSFSVSTAESKALRAGMVCTVQGDQYTILEVDGNTVTLSAALGDVDADLKFTHPDNNPGPSHTGVLEFPTTGLITGINILDDTIFWTDNVTEPKRINITKSIAGTGGSMVLPSAALSGDNADFHTRFVRVTPDTINSLEILTYAYNGSDYPRYTALQDVTVIRKAPTQALNVEAFSTEDARAGRTTGYVNGVVIYAGDYSIGDDITGLTFTFPVDFRVGDTVLFSAMGGASSSDGGYDIKTKVTASPVSDDNPTSSFTGFTFEVKTISPDLLDTFNDWIVEVDDGNALYEDKFARFSYRYKYIDGEYSTFAPWSEVAFIPGVYNYFAQEGYNKGMVNTVRNLELKNYVPANIPYGVINIDILYKEANNPTVYTVKTVTPDEPTYTLKTDMVHAVVASNQLLRPWDNVPRKALAQEVSANRLIYGNYVQNFNVTKDPGVAVTYQPTAIEQFSAGTPSLKSLREYQLGVVFSDGYGRETPVLTQEGSSIKIPAEAVVTSNKLSVALSQKNLSLPTWAKYYSFYIKEPTVEYYTLAMDRWYNAADGNIWISFPSSERNKLDEETFLYLKKAHGNNIPITNGAKYKILAIENEAPEYVKTVYEQAGSIDNSDSEDALRIGNSEGGYPLVGSRVVSTSYATGMSLAEDLSKAYRLRFSTSDHQNMSRAYDVDKITKVGDTMFFHLHGALGNDLDFATEVFGGYDNLWEGRIADLKMHIYSGVAKNRPEFDGRFFVKILKDFDITNLVTSFESDDWLVYDQQEIGYINNNSYIAPNDPIPRIPNSAEWYETNTTAATLLAHPTEHSHHGGYDWVGHDDGYDISAPNPVEVINESSEFWESRSPGFFIDKCSAFSWSGRLGNLPGNFIENGDSTYFGDDGHWWGTNIDAQAGYAIDEKLQQYSIFNSESIYSGFLTNVLGAMDTRGMPSRGIWNSWSWGFMDLSWTGYTPANDNFATWSKFWSLATSGSYGWPSGAGWSNVEKQVSKLSEDPLREIEARFMESLYRPGAKFRFKNDPDKTPYTVHSWGTLLKGIDYNGSESGTDGSPLYSNFNEVNQVVDNSWPSNWDSSFYRHGHWGIRNYQTPGFEGQYEPKNLRQKWTIKVKPNFGSGPSGYIPTTGTIEGEGIEQVRALHHDGTDMDAIQLLTPTTVDENGNDISGGFTRNPAVWETAPKESVDIDIYYQASDIIPLRANRTTMEDFAPTGTTFISGSTVYTISSWSEVWDSASGSYIQRANLSSALDAAIASSSSRVLITPNGRESKVHLVGVSGDTYVDIAPDSTGWHFASTRHALTWSNCWSFGNGVESDRIRDDYNAPQMDNGVKASTVLAGQSKEERRKHGLIWSGIYNSTSGVNDTNQFIMAEAITKDLNPSHGSIQRLLNRDTRLVMFCEDKVLRAVTNKDALYNADGNPQLVASNKVIGDVQPYDGNYGISKNPESLAVAPATAYFTDASRGRVLALSTEGVRAISSYGMEGYFLGLKNLISGTNSIIGTFDDKTREYNLSTGGDATVSYGEKSKSWVSFKSFSPQTGISLNNEFYTFSKGDLWKHHVETDTSGGVVNRNTFYGDFGNSSVTVVLSDTAGGVKSFNTINYEGSRAKTSAFTESLDSILTGDYSINGGLDTNETTYDGEYYNLAAKTGWYMESMKTDLQAAGETEFKEKEGKWFGVLSGKDLTAVNTAEFSTQGLGVASSVSYAGAASGNVAVTFKNSDGFPWD